MTDLDRRRFLQISGGAAAATFLSDSIARAATIPARRTTGTLNDIDHIVVLTQENRSFDHYFGSMRGVRGFGDPHPAIRKDGRSVWFQSDGTRDHAPFHPDHADLGLTFLEDLDHSWGGGHKAFNNGNYDQWIPAKTATTMAYLQRDDMPFHYALADAFTVCDNYHCSVMGPTDPNRYYMWTGWVGNDGVGGGPVIDNAERGYDWTTYPERLEKAGVSWKIYQDSGSGLDAANGWGYSKDPFVGNYGDNSLLYFDNYRNASPGDALYVKARTGTTAATTGDRSLFDQLKADVTGGALPSISWVVAPEAYTEHPSWPVNYGAWYIANVVNALTSDPDVWGRTALLITYDENDGFFDHVVPPHPHGAGIPGDSTVSVSDEIFSGSGNVTGAYGLGQRVPMMVVSPWSSGGWVCSEVFDHTSIIRFMEQRFGVAEPNITDWRRSVCGDLTSAFDFGKKKARVPNLPATEQYRPAKHTEPSYRPTPPAGAAVPRQEAGARPSRALGYALTVSIATSTTSNTQLGLDNSGSLGAHFQLRSAVLPAPYSFTVGAGASLQPTVAATALQIHGPNGFYRDVKGTAKALTVSERIENNRLVLAVANTGSMAITVSFVDEYGPDRTSAVAAGATARFSAASRQGWYDVQLRVADHVRQIAGRVESGAHSVSDPRIGR